MKYILPLFILILPFGVSAATLKCPSFAVAVAAVKNTTDPVININGKHWYYLPSNKGEKLAGYKKWDHVEITGARSPALACYASKGTDAPMLLSALPYGAFSSCTYRGVAIPPRKLGPHSSGWIEFPYNLSDVLECKSA